MMESTCTPKSSQSRFISQGCKKHTRLRHRPLQFTHDFISVQHSGHSNTSLASLFEESSLCSSLGEIDTSWFDSERWTSNDETKWKKEDILKTPQASQRESKIFSTPGLFTPDRPSPVCKQCKDYPECNPPPDEESASSFVRPKRFRKVPSSIHTTPNSQIITSHQPTSGPIAETIQEEDEGERGPVDVQFSPFPTWNPTSNKDTPIFMKHLFKTPSTLFGAGDKRACSTPLQRLSTPQRLSRSLGAEPEESDLSWTSSLATPPMSSKSKTVTSSNKKHIEDDTWQTHVVAKVLFQDGGSVVEMDSCEEGDEGSTQPLKVVKFPSINDDSQEEEFTIETEDGGESDKSLGGGRKEIPAPMFNDKSDESRVQMVTRDSLVLPTSLVQPPVTDNGEPPLAKHQEHESINESVDSKTVSELYVQEGGSVREKVVGPSVDIIAELDAKKNVSGDSTETNAFSELDCKQWKKSPVQPAMSSQQSSVIGSNHASQTLFNSQESTKNDKTAMEETLAFLLATPPSRRGKLLDRLCASGSSIGAGTFIEQGACDALGSILDVKNKLSDSSQSAPMKSVLDDTFMSPAGLLCKPMKSGFDEGQERKSLGSESSMNGKPDNGVVETPIRPAPDVDLLSPISPNYAEALCRVTDIASREQPIGSKNTLSGQKSLGVERNLIDIFENPYYEEIIHIKVTDQLRSGGHDDPLVKQTLHPTEANRPNTSVAKNSSSSPSSFPSSANNKLPKPFLSKLEACEAMSTSKPVAVANLKTQSVTKGRFKYTAPAQAPRKDGGNISKTPSWLSRAVYVEEEEDEKEKEEKKVDAVQAETLGESSKKGWTMKRPCPLPTSFTTFSTFCKTAPNPLTRAIPTAESQTASSTTPTSSRSAMLSAPPHNKSLVRIREFPHSWPSPKRLRLDEERDECNMESDMSNLLPIDECDVKIPNLAPVGSDEMPPRTQDQVSLVINNAGNGQECVEDLHNKFNSTDNVLFTEVHGTTQNVGFSSASGRAILVSSESLKKAEKLIGDVDKEKPPEEYQLNLSSADPQCGFQSASGKSIQVSDEALTKAKKIIDEVGLYDETIHDSPGKSSLSVGFTSARGNVINISAAAMAKARTIMNDINHDEESKSIGQEGRVLEISGLHHVDGGGDRNMIQNKKGVQSGGLSGNAQLKRTMENRQRHKGFRPFKPPSLVANIQKPSHLTSSIPSLNQTSEIDLIKESDRGNGLKTCEDCIPVGLQEGNATMPELKIITLQQEQKIETSESSNMPREKKKLDSGNLQSIENSDISDDDCLSATQAAREIKAAEEMELVYNFMQEEDTGFSQLDVSSIIAAGHSEKGAAQILKCPEYHTDPNKESQVSNSQDHQMFNHTIGPTSSQDFLTEQRGNVSLLESKLKRSKAMGAIKETTDRNEVLSTSMKHNDVQFETMVQKRIDESEQYLASPNHAERVTLDLKQNGDYSKVETDTIKESPAVDQSVKMIGQVMDDNAILTKETEGLRLKDKEQQEVSHTDTHEPYQGTCSIDVTKISRSAQQSSYVRHVECIDESLSNDKNKAHIPGDHLQPDILNATSYQENDSIPDQKKRDKPRLKMDVTLGACGPVGFKTVEGQTIEVSEAALQKATLLLSDHNSDGETNKQLNPDISDKSFNQLIPTLLAHYMSISHATCHQENMELPEQAKIPECRPLINVLQGEKLLIDDNNCGSTIRNSSMSEEEPASSSVSEVCQAGLQTAGGKDIKVAKSALQMAKTVIGDNHENNPLNYSIDSKASKGNKVYVSNSALQKARKVIESALENVPECSPGRSSMIHQNTTDSKTTSYTMNKHDIVHSEQASQKYSSQTGLSPKVAALEPVLSEYNDVSGNLSNTESGLLVAFHTASGNKISISDDALQKARRLVSNEIKSFDEGAIEKSTTDSHSKQVAPIDTFENINGDRDEISDALPIGERQPIANDTDSCNNGNTANQHDRASVARDLNSNIPFSKSRLQRKKYGDSFDNSLGQMGLEFITKSSPRKLGFQTARGGSISVSDESLKKAKQLLRKDSRHENIQEISGLKETLFESSKLMTGLQTGSGKHIQVSESAIQVGKQLLSNDLDISNGGATSSLHQKHPDSAELEVGFQTGDGRIQVSESSILKARQLLCDESNQKVMEFSGLIKKETSRQVQLDSAKFPDTFIGEEKQDNTSKESSVPTNRKTRDQQVKRVSRSLESQKSHIKSVPVGFQSGHGRKVQISEMSLQRAKEFLADESSEVPDQNIAVSFQTGHGKKVKVSESSLQRAKEFLADKSSEVSDQNIAVGFQTGHGKKVKVSEASLQRAMKFLTDESSEVPDQNIAVGFQTGHGKKVKVSEASLQRAKKFLADESSEVPDKNIAVGFQTGHGKKVQVSEASLQRAKEFLADESSEVPDQNIVVGFETGHGKKVKVSEASIQRAKKFLADESSEVPDKNIAVGFQTGHGKKVQVSEASLQRAKEFLVDESSEVPDQNIVVGFKTGHGKKVQVSEASLQRAKEFLSAGSDAQPDQNIAVGFQTGHGTKVQVSEKSLKKAKKLFAAGSDVEPENLAVCFHTGHVNKVQVSEASPQRAKKFLSDEFNKVPVQNIAVGFQTGHGKKVHVSEASLQRAKKFLADKSNEVQDQNTTTGFQTGHGKKVQISEESLKKAKEFFTDKASKETDQVIAIGFQTGHGKKVKLSEASLQRAKEFIAAGSDVEPENLAVCFQTGHGTKVQVSEKSLEKAKEFLADESVELSYQNTTGGLQKRFENKDQVSEATLQRPKQSLAMESDVGTELHDSAVCGDAYEKSFSEKSYMMTGFMTGDGRKVQVSEASLQLAKNNSDSEVFTDVSREIGQRELHVPPGSQHQNLSSSADGNSPTHQGKNLTENQKLGRDPLKGGCSLTNLPPQKHHPGGLTKRGLVDMRNRQLNQQSNRRGSLPTGQKPYKPPRRVNEKVSSSSRGLVPRGSNPTVILNDRTKPIKALQSSPPSSRHSISNERLHETGPFLKPSLNLHTTTTNQSQNKLEATPIPEEGACSFVARWDEARRAQQQRINAKRGRLIKPELGSLWRCRKEDDRISLKDFVNHQYPCSMTDSQLFGNGILCSTLSVRPSNAEGYEFAGEDHFSPTCLENSQGILLADGGRLVFNSSCLAGKKEFYNALLDTPGVDPKLLKEDWVCNHYKWIIWKAAAMEVAYPLQFGGRLLTPNWVLLQLKYRYDREIDHSQRPALRKILERDDAASRRMVLCVAAINHTGSSTQHHGKSPQQSKSSQPSSHPTLELTDGWYSISAIIDTPLANYVRSGKILCGTKLCIYGAELIGSQDACSPLEIPESLKLKIAANSTRRARFDARLGLQCDPRPFPLPTTSLHPDGGSVGCIDVLILRSYPMQFMEKLPEGGSVFRNAKEEAKAATLHANQKQHKMEQLFTQVQKQFEAKQSHKVKGRRSLPSSRSRNSSELERLQSGEELFEAFEAAIDPSAFESDLSEYQRCILHAYQRTLNDMKQANLQAAFNQALAQQNKEGKFERNVVPLMKVRIADYKASTTRGQQTTFLTIWRPADDLLSQLVEGKRFRISSLSTSAGRNMPDMAPVQLASTRATRYEEIPAASHILQRSYIPRAAASMQWLGRGYTQAAYGELDVVGVVVSQDKPRQHPGSSHSHVVYLADQDTAIMAIKFWTSPTALNLDDMLKPGSFISASNLHYRSITQSPVVLPTATASDYTVFTPNPKANYLQVSINQLKQAIKDTPKFVEMVQRKVQELKDASSKPMYPSSIPRNHSYMARRERITTPIASQSQTRIGIQPTPEVSHGQGYQLMTVRSCPKNFMKTSKSIKDEVCNTRMKLSGISRVSSTLTPRTPCQSPVPGVSLSPRLISQHLEQERRAELLSCIPSPPPLAPLPYPAASPALRRGFKIPSPSVRGSQKREPEKSLRKRLRDELDKENDGACEQKSNKQSNAKAVHGDHTMKKQKVNNRDDISNLKTVASEPANSNFESKMGECEAKEDNDFSDDLGLSASGLQELEMGWSQSEVLTEPAVGEQPLKMNISASEKACPLESMNSMKENKDPILVDISSENDNHSREPEDKHHAFGSESDMEGSIQPCKDVTSNITQDFHPGRQPIQYGQVVEHTTQNNDYPTNLTKIDSHMTLTCVTQTTRACTSVDSRSHSLPPLCKSINGNVKEVSGCITENAEEDTDIPVKVHANSNCTENIQETTQDTDAADNHLNSLRSPSSHEINDATKEDKLMESDLLHQSRGMDSSSQNSASINESQERSEQDKSSRSLSPKGKKRKCLRLQRKKAVVDSGAVIEILEDDNSPLLKRSSRLRVQEKKSYKL